ncbi:spondin domain-containing protein [Marinifilum fragile]|uniref:spondin domain-containing protein n=1 Tax=Marinifilum fragile TaxID=570161 RepID=UPI002AA8C39D|nr:spondin domain-containing protein [Marinifilum fragile]
MKNLLLFAVASLFVLSACDNDNDTFLPPVASGNFTVTIENVQTGKAFFKSGTTDAAGPGGSYSYTFNAGKGAYLSFATMFVQSNDLFYGFGDTGLALYDANGDAVTGDVTSEVMLWDAGTEVNEEPGVGVNQAPRQSGPNTGTTENGTVKEVADGFTYPANDQVIKVELSHDGSTEFTVTVTNVSDMYAFQTPIAPGVWVVHNSGMPIFEENMDAANGLEALAEDGGNSDIGMYLEDNSGFVSPFAPGVFVVNHGGLPLFKDGNPDFGNGLEALAEDGSPADLNASLEGLQGVNAHGIFSVPVGGSGGAPIFPGESYEFTFEASELDYFNLATMLVQSNDLFVAFEDKGIYLFKNGIPVTGDVTNQLMLWDAGTEVNEYPGAGNNQAPRQSGPNTGDTEVKAVMEVNDGFTYPAITDLIRITITAN